MRVTIDTNIVVSGTLWSGNPRRLLDAARDEVFELFTTQILIDELTEVLGREKFSERLRAAGLTIARVVDNFSFVATIVEPEPIAPVVLRDPDDDAVIACALAAHADLIVSGDDDLLDLREYRGIRIVSATELLNELNL